MTESLDYLNGTLIHPDKISLDATSYGSTSTFIKGSFALLLRAGYLLIQLGSIPIENVYVILLQNILDIAVTLAAFGLIGFSAAYGSDNNGGLIGYGMWIISNSANLDEAVTGFCACLIGSGIITTLLSGRCHFFAYLLISFIYSGLCLPVLIHWVWYNEGLMRRVNFLDKLVSVKDHAGCLIIHFVSGLIGFIGSLFLGRRLMRLDEIDQSSIGPESSGSTIIGYIFIIVGLIGFTLPTPIYESTHIPANYIGIVLVNNIMAIAAGVSMVVIMQFLCYRETYNYWSILRCMQGAIAGIVTISAGVDVYIPLISYASAFLGAFIFYMTVVCIQNSSIEDYCNVISIHLTCGCLGTLLPALLASGENLGYVVSISTRSIHLLWQFVCLAIIALTITIIFVIIFSILCVTNLLRNKNEDINHTRGVIASGKLGTQYFLKRLFSFDQSTSFIEPGTVGKTTGDPSRKHNASSSQGSLVQVRFRENERQEDSSEIDKVPKNRFVYTIFNSENKVKEEIIGDGLDKSASKKLSKIPVIQAKADPSCYDLHRSGKSTSLIKCNGWKLNKNNQKASEFHDFERSIELISYDKRINIDPKFEMPLNNCKDDDDVV